MSIHSNKVIAVARCYVENRRDGDSHEQAEDKIYRLSANMQIDSYQLRKGLELGGRKFGKK